MRHAHPSTTQRYLGKVIDVKAMRWIENLYGLKDAEAAHQHTAPATMILVVWVRKGEKIQNRIRSRLFPKSNQLVFYSLHQLIPFDLTEHSCSGSVRFYFGGMVIKVNTLPAFIEVIENRYGHP